MIFPTTLPSGAQRFTVRFPNPSGQKLRQSYRTRELAEAAVKSWQETGQMPKGPKRVGRPNIGPRPRVTKYVGKSVTRWQAAVRFQENGKQRLVYLRTHDTEEQAFEQARQYIDTGVIPPRPVKVKIEKPKLPPKKRGPKPGFKMALFVPRVNPTGADRWREVYQQRCA